MKSCGVYSVLVCANLIFFGHVLADITTERTDALDVGIESYEQKWPWECENILQTVDGDEKFSANALGKILCEKKVELATMEENYKGRMNTQATVCENQMQAAKMQEKLLVANYEQKIKHLQLEKSLVSQNCDLKIVLNSVNTTVVYQDCQQRLQTCENKATPKSDCGQQQSFLKETTGSEVEALLRPKLLLDLINLPTGAYYISNEKENWYAASKRCKYSGMELVSIESKQENDAILGVIGNATEDFWLSGTDLGNEGDFYWASTGHPFGLFSDWMIKMPDNFRNNEHCVQFHSAGGLKWNDNNCNRAYKFICELVQ